MWFIFYIKCKTVFGIVCVFSWQNWDVFQEITEIFILVPAVLGMKGNLEMTLASRLSTAVSVCMLTHTHTHSHTTCADVHTGQQFMYIDVHLLSVIYL